MVIMVKITHAQHQHLLHKRLLASLCQRSFTQCWLTWSPPDKSLLVTEKASIWASVYFFHQQLGCSWHTNCPLVSSANMQNFQKLSKRKCESLWDIKAWLSLVQVSDATKLRPKAEFCFGKFIFAFSLSFLPLFISLSLLPLLHPPSSPRLQLWPHTFDFPWFQSRQMSRLQYTLMCETIVSFHICGNSLSLFLLQQYNAPVHKARSIKKGIPSLVWKSSTGLHRAQTLTPPNSCGMNWSYGRFSKSRMLP